MASNTDIVAETVVVKAKVENIKPKTVKVYNSEEFEALLNGLKVPACMFTEPHQIVNEKSVIRRLSALTLNGPSDGNCCSCCGVGPFETRAEQIAHYKQHWHTYNLKRKLYGKPPLTLCQFNTRLDDDSSVSGSDSEAESTGNNPASDLFAAATRHCKAFFTNKRGQVFCIYRCILHHRKEQLSTDGHGQAWIERCRRIAIPVFQRWAIIMVSGGHFAGGIFSGNEPVVHKTYHTYVTRRGQGQAQCTRDLHGPAPKSAGASLRKRNQMLFGEHVTEIIVGWAEDLLDCSLILYRAVGYINQFAIFNKKSPLKKDDPRLRVLPFPTRKPTYKEVQRVHEIVASVEVYETMELFQKALIASSSSKSSSKSGTESGMERKKSIKSSPGKVINRAKSRERTPRALPTQMLSSEDEGPCYIDSETPKDWIKTLSEQSSNGVITNSRKDLLNDCTIASPECTESERESLPEKKDNREEDKRIEVKKKPEEKKNDKKEVQKIPNNIKKMWKAILGKEQTSLETILEGWEGAQLEAACNTQDPNDGNTALHKAAIAAKPEMVTQILTAGGDPCIRNHQAKTPYVATPHPDTRIAFRLFQALYPEKYDYSKSYIPGPVTPELLEQEKERKAQQKRAKRRRDKERHVEKLKTNHFTQLTDAEKVRTGEKKCFLCGARLPKKAFEYGNYKFCTITCMQNHRNIRPLHMSA